MIKIEKIKKILKQKHQSVHSLVDIDLEFERGGFTVIAGPSGSGKTTLLNILGLLDKPTSGTYFFDNENMINSSSRSLADFRRKKIGFIFQSYNLMPVLTALENTEMVMEINGVEKNERRQIALETLKNLGLADLGTRYPDQLSGGQQQRVAVARAIAAKPQLVIADEPTANLDSKSATALLDLMKSLNQQHGITFILILGSVEGQESISFLPLSVNEIV